MLDPGMGRARLLRFEPLEEVGVERLRFHGDGAGGPPLAFERVVNSYVREVTVVNVARGLQIEDSAATSVLFYSAEGRPGHDALTLTSSSHTFGVAARSSGTVFHRVAWPGNTSVELRGGGA